MKESKIEKYLVKQVEAIGGKAYKMLPTFDAGIPDRLVLHKGRTVFVELKAPGEKPAKLQVNFLAELEKMEHETRVIDSLEGVDKLIVDLKCSHRVALLSNPAKCRDCGKILSR